MLDVRNPRDRAIIEQITAAQGGGGYGTQYQAVYDSLTTKPSASIATAQNTMVTAIVNSGAWAKLDLFYMFAQTTNGGSEALKNWINPGTFDATLTNAPAFVALEGFTPNGSTSYIDTNYNLSSDGTNFVQNSSSLGVYIRDTVADALKALAGGLDVSPNTYTQIIPNYSGNWTAAINDATNLSTANSSNEAGMYAIFRDNVNDVRSFKNFNIKSGSIASVGVPNEDLYIGCRNNNGSANAFSTYQMSWAFCGGTLTQTEFTNMTNAVEAYMVSNSKGVM